MSRKVILIDDSYKKGWRDIFAIIFKDIYGDLIQFECLESLPENNNPDSPFTNFQINECYQNNPDAVFIQDNQLGSKVKSGLEWVQKYGKTHCIIMHTADHSIGFDAAKAGATYFMKKDIPVPGAMMSNKEMQDQIILFHKHIIHHFGLVPELIWLVYMKMGRIEQEKEVEHV